MPIPTRNGRNFTDFERIPLAESDPMASNNPNAVSGARGYNKTSSSKKKWWIIGAIVAILVIVGAVVGGVVGSRKSGSSSSSSSTSSNGTGAIANTGLPSGVTNVNSAAATATGANGEVYLAVATNSQYMLPVYATGVSLT